MSILILYLSRHGTVEEVVKMMKNISGEKVDIKKLDSHITGAVLDKYDSLIVGGAIRMEKAPRKLIKFVRQYAHYFKEKKSGVFLCTLTEPRKAGHYLEETYPPEVLENCHATGLFGGAVKYEKMSPMEKTIMKKITGIDKSYSKLDTDRIAAFIESF